MTRIYGWPVAALLRLGLVVALTVALAFGLLGQFDHPHDRFESTPTVEAK